MVHYMCETVKGSRSGFVKKEVLENELLEKESLVEQIGLASLFTIFFK